MQSILWVILFLSLAVFLPKPVDAHAFGQLYNLPVPFSIYIYGAVLTIVASFFIFGFFLQKRKDIFYPELNLSNFIPIKFAYKKNIRNVIEIISVSIFLITIVTGLFGVNDSYSNFNMTFFWIIFYLGLTYFIAIFGNLYSIVNPWKIIINWYELFVEEKLTGRISYPEKLSYWPSLIFYFIFFWIELIAQFDPFNLSIIIITYTLVNFLGAYLIGKKKWFKYCEFFSVYFSLISKISPFEYRYDKIFIGFPLVRALKAPETKSFSLLIFIFLILSSTAFDGFREITPWYRFYWMNIDPILRPILRESSFFVIQNSLLLISPFFFLFLYLLANFVSKVFARVNSPVLTFSFKFMYSLIPIAFAYNFAHYYTLIITQGAGIINLISDPFGFNWNIFGTADYSTGFTVDANITWHIQVATILIGHIAGVYLAHSFAVLNFNKKRDIFVSQIPMTILMVFYTVIGLWILSQPITSGI